MCSDLNYMFECKYVLWEKQNYNNSVFCVTISYKFNDEQINKRINWYSFFICDNPFKGLTKNYREKNCTNKAIGNSQIWAHV